MEYPLDHLFWIEEQLPPGAMVVPKYGGLAYYIEQKLMLILVEQRDSTYEHKEVTYPFQIWYGAIFPIEYKKQSAFFLKYSFLENHPANRDWLYIPADRESFEEEVKQLLREIHQANPLMGTALKFKAVKEEKPPEAKAKRKAAKPAKANKKRENTFILTMVNKSKKS